MKNFDFISRLAETIPDFAQLHAYCDKAEIFQKAFPEESASNARKALEWLVKNHLYMANVTLDKHETLNQMLKRPQIDAFIDEDWEFEQYMRTVKKIGNYASHTGAQEVKPNDAFICLRALYYVVSGFLYRWRAIQNIVAFDATLVPNGFTGIHIADNSEPTVSVEVADSIPTDAIDNPTAPTYRPKESLESEAITRKCIIDYMLNEAKWQILAAKGDIQGGKAAIEVEGELAKLLAPLGIPNVRFKVQIATGELAQKGVDKVMFLFSANKSTDMLPVSQVASGGEIARVMLSLKAMISKAIGLPTIIFDEIDTGVSGRVAEQMAHIMRGMGDVNRQVICITHLPQIAAYGSTHYKVAKHEAESGTVSTMTQLTPDQRITEIAQMLSGSDVTQAAIDNAKSLLMKEKK